VARLKTLFRVIATKQELAYGPQRNQAGHRSDDKERLRVKRGPGGEWTTSTTPAAGPQVVHHHGPVGGFAPAPAALPAVAVALPLTTPAPTAAASIPQIVSPMVGTFYLSPSPDSPPYVTVGQEVQEDTVVCIIEAMKVMNEIKAETRGVIVEVLAQNGKPVEFGKPLFAVRPT
jgi:acetyl-CoA carboxylase biotin carboxyl carrier protein